MMTVRPLDLSRALGGRFGREAVLADAVSWQLPAVQDELVQLLDPFVEALAGDGAGRLDVPVVARAEFFEAEERLDLGHVQRCREVLLVGQDQDWDVTTRLPDLEQLQLGLL